MDVLNKLRNTVSNTISNTVHNTAYGLSQLSSVLPGNPVTREYEVTAHIASAGPGLLWKIYSGCKKSTKQEAAIFVFEKRILEKWSSKHDRDLVLETLKRGVTQLTKLRHPQILTVQHPLEESRDSLAFATEPVLASLANVLGNLENVPHPPSGKLKDYKLLDIEIRYGLLQLGEGLTFLHGDVKLLHRNICPESILVDQQGAWKIFGFDFCTLNQNTDTKQLSWPYMEYDPTSPSVVQPNLDYQAPECILASSNGPQSDIFSLGMLVYVVHSPDNRQLHDSQNDLTRCKRFLESLKSSNAVTSKLISIPEHLRDPIKLMLSHSPELRPDAHQFIKIDYFMDIGIKTLNYLDKLFQWDNLQKSQFYKELPQVLKQLPHRVVLYRILPALYKELVNPPMIPFVLPNILQVMESTDVEEFREHILPHLKPILALEDPPQITLVLLQRVDMLLKLCPTDVIKNDIVPMLTRSLESEWEQVQELCLAALPSIVTMIDGSVMKNAILPKMKKLCTNGKVNGCKSLGIRVNCLLCLAKLLPNFDKWLILDQILPFLQEIPHTGEPAILMVVIGIYRLLLSHSKYGIGKEILATKMLPFLLPLCIEQSLSLPQFETLVSLVLDMINRVMNEHREALRQLDSVRQESQRLDGTFVQTSSSNTYAQVFSNANLSEILNNSDLQTSDIKIENGLSIEEKFRSIQQRETHQRLQSQPLLTPTAAQQPKKHQPLDLTDTLLKTNLDNLKLSSVNSTTRQANRSDTNSPMLKWNNHTGASQMQSQSVQMPNLTTFPLNSVGPHTSRNQEYFPSSWNQTTSQNAMAPTWANQMNYGNNREFGATNFSSNNILQASLTNKTEQPQISNPLSNKDIMDLLS